MAYSIQNYGSTEQRTDVPDVGFSPTELYNLSESITINVYTINKSWYTLRGIYKHIGTNKDTEGLRDKVHETQQCTNIVVSQTSKGIARLIVLMRRGDKQQKLHIEKLTTDFKDALQKYSDMQKSLADKMKRYTLKATSNSDTQVLDEEEEQEKLVQLQKEEGRIEQRELEFEQGLILEREENIRKIEGDILDVNQIMRELSALVCQQGETISTIENSIENVQGNVELGTEQLIKARDYQRKYLKKAVILLIIAVIVVIIIIVSYLFAKQIS